MSDRPNPTGTEKQSQLSVAVETGTRKGPRLPLEFAVVARYQAANGEMVRTNCRTVSVAVNGALLALRGTLEVGQPLQLTNAKTGEEVPCIVRSVRPSERDNLNHVGIEFSLWMPEFWEITFPRQEGDPLPGNKAKPARPFFGRVGPMPALPGEKTRAGEETGDTPERFPAVAKLSRQLRRNRKATIAMAAVLASAALWVMRPSNQEQTSGVSATAAAPFVLPERIARAIPDSAGFRLAAVSDFAPQAAGFLQSMGQTVSGEMEGDFAGTGHSAAYLLLRNDKTWRVAIVADGQLRCDARYQSVAIAARIPREMIRRIQWSEAPSAEPDGDGLLVVRSAGQAGASVVLFLRGTEVISGTPADYREIPALLMP